MKRFRLRHALLLLAIAAATLAFPAGASAFNYLGEFGTPGTGAGQMQDPEGVGIGPNGHVYVGEYSGDRVDEFTSTGTFVRMWGWGVQNGAPAFQVCTAGCQAAIGGTGDGQFNEVADVDVDPVTGDVYALEAFNHRVQQFTSTGGFIRKWGSSGATEGQFGDPLGLDVSASAIYVADASNNNVQQFTLDGSFVRMWGWGVDDGTLAFQVCTAGCQAGIGGSGDGQFSAAFDATAGASGDVYVADGNNRIQQFSSAGSFIRKFGQPGSLDGELNSAQGLTTDAAGNVWATEYGNDRIQEFSSTGTFMFKFGTVGSGPGQFSDPFALNFDCRGNLYVADLGNGRIQKLGEPGLGEPPCPKSTPAASPDLTAPKQTVKARKKQRTASLSISLTLNEAAAVTLDGSVNVPGASKTVKFKTLKKSVGANQTTKLKPKLSKKNGKRVKKALKNGKKLTAKFKIKATDAAGNSSNSKLKIRLKR
jgi:hypothetical protein